MIHISMVLTMYPFTFFLGSEEHLAKVILNGSHQVPIRIITVFFFFESVVSKLSTVTRGRKRGKLEMYIYMNREGKAWV